MESSNDSQSEASSVPTEIENKNTAVPDPTPSQFYFPSYLTTPPTTPLLNASSGTSEPSSLDLNIDTASSEAEAGKAGISGRLIAPMKSKSGRIAKGAGQPKPSNSARERQVEHPQPSGSTRKRPAEEEKFVDGHDNLAADTARRYNEITREAIERGTNAVEDPRWAEEDEKWLAYEEPQKDKKQRSALEQQLFPDSDDDSDDAPEDTNGIEVSPASPVESDAESESDAETEVAHEADLDEEKFDHGQPQSELAEAIYTILDDSHPYASAEIPPEYLAQPAETSTGSTLMRNESSLQPSAQPATSSHKGFTDDISIPQDGNNYKTELGSDDHETGVVGGQISLEDVSTPVEGGLNRSPSSQLLTDIAPAQQVDNTHGNSAYLSTAAEDWKGDDHSWFDHTMRPVSNNQELTELLNEPLANTISQHTAAVEQQQGENYMILDNAQVQAQNPLASTETVTNATSASIDNASTVSAYESDHDMGEATPIPQDIGAGQNQNDNNAMDGITPDVPAIVVIKPEEENHEMADAPELPPQQSFLPTPSGDETMRDAPQHAAMTSNVVIPGLTLFNSGSQQSSGAPNVASTAPSPVSGMASVLTGNYDSSLYTSSTPVSTKSASEIPSTPASTITGCLTLPAHISSSMDQASPNSHQRPTAMHLEWVEQPHQIARDSSSSTNTLSPQADPTPPTIPALTPSTPSGKLAADAGKDVADCIPQTENGNISRVFENEHHCTTCPKGEGKAAEEGKYKKLSRQYKDYCEKLQEQRDKAVEGYNLACKQGKECDRLKEEMRQTCIKSITESRERAKEYSAGLKERASAEIRSRDCAIADLQNATEQKDKEIQELQVQVASAAEMQKIFEQLRSQVAAITEDRDEAFEELNTELNRRCTLGMSHPNLKNMEHDSEAFFKLLHQLIVDLRMKRISALRPQRLMQKYGRRWIIASLKSHREKALKAREEDHQSKLKKQRDEFDAEIERLHDAHSTELRKLRAEHNDPPAEQKIKSDAPLNALSFVPLPSKLTLPLPLPQPAPVVQVSNNALIATQGKGSSIAKPATADQQADGDASSDATIAEEEDDSGWEDVSSSENEENNDENCDAEQSGDESDDEDEDSHEEPFTTKTDEEARDILLQGLFGGKKITLPSEQTDKPVAEPSTSVKVDAPSALPASPSTKIFVPITSATTAHESEGPSPQSTATEVMQIAILATSATKVSTKATVAEGIARQQALYEAKRKVRDEEREARRIRENRAPFVPFRSRPDIREDYRSPARDPTSGATGTAAPTPATTISIADRLRHGLRRDFVKPLSSVKYVGNSLWVSRDDPRPEISWENDHRVRSSSTYSVPDYSDDSDSDDDSLDSDSMSLSSDCISIGASVPDKNTLDIDNISAPSQLIDDIMGGNDCDASSELDSPQSSSVDDNYFYKKMPGAWISDVEDPTAATQLSPEPSSDGSWPLMLGRKSDDQVSYP